MKFKLQCLTTLIVFLGCILGGCTDEPDYKNTVRGNFDALVELIETRYCFFKEKDIDWKSLSEQYRELITDETTEAELFFICSALLNELKDGHVNLTSPFSTSYYREWWSDYPQDFNLRTLQQYYLDFNYLQTSGISYKIIGEDTGYMYYPSFSSGISELSLDYILAILQDAKALIIDIRNNGGGMLTNVGVLVSRFIDSETSGGFISHKTGPGHDDFSEPYPITYSPAGSSRIHWPVDKPIYVLTNRSCFSAANDFVSVMKTLPNVKIVGARTGGGGGLPLNSELPNGWALRFSSCPMYSPDGSITEFGIDPSEGCEVHCTDEELAAGYDAILEFALKLASEEGKGKED